MGKIYNADKFFSNLADKMNRPTKKIADNLNIEDLVANHHINRFTNLTKDELKDKFISTAETLPVTIKRTTIERFNLILKDTIIEFNGGPIILNDDNRLHNLKVVDTIRDEFKFHVWDYRQNRYNIDFAANANIGIVHADIAFAETGGIALESNYTRGRSVSLLPKYSIVILHEDQIKPRIHQYSNQLHERALKNERIPSCINIISGPSSTADIELIKVIGVHGPISVIYIIIESSN